jgi:hypothetical protein
LLTRSVFTAYNESPSPDRAALVGRLSKLKGIGPATASLILAVFDPDGAVFFGDEVFRWVGWDELTKAGKGWSRRIGYNLTEYRQLDRLASDVVKRLGVKAVEVEMVGYVLGREKVEVDSESQSVGLKEPQADQSVEKRVGAKRKNENQESRSEVQRSRRKVTTG